MKTLGIIGGIAPGSTIDYYRLLVEGYRDRMRDGRYPPLIINSIDMTRMLELIGAQRLPELVDYLRLEVERLARAGADFGLLASNTPHLVFEELARVSPIPLASIVESAAARATTMGLRRVGLLGTRFTMDGRFYPQVFSRSGIAVVSPSPEEREYVHGIYMGELTQGQFRDETRRAVLEIMRRMVAREQLDGLLLAGTELPLLLRGVDADLPPLIDTTQAHVERALDLMLENRT